ncbi:hypothetical protein WN48_10036 [Eufriesea mexicana]|nr:hypothetical protein WN48_10036 [Eufriesea mexicana]
MVVKRQCGIEFHLGYGVGNMVFPNASNNTVKTVFQRLRIVLYRVDEDELHAEGAACGILVMPPFLSLPNPLRDTEHLGGNKAQIAGCNYALFYDYDGSHRSVSNGPTSLRFGPRGTPWPWEKPMTSRPLKCRPALAGEGASRAHGRVDTTLRMPLIGKLGLLKIANQRAF